jgi:hypothetical protein
MRQTRQGQHRDVFVLGPLGIDLQIFRDMADHRPVLEHRQLGPRGRPRGGAENGDIRAFPGIDQCVEGVRMGFVDGRPHRAQLAQRHQARVVVFAHAARIVEDDLLDRGDAVPEVQQLVDLRLVLGQDHPAAGIADEIFDLLVQRVAIDAEAGRAKAMGRDLAEDPLRPVVADQGDGVVPADPQFAQAEGDLAHMIAVLGPGNRAPQAEILLAHGDLAAMAVGMMAQQFGQGVQTLEIGQFGQGPAHCAALSSAPASSSSSPR